MSDTQPAVTARSGLDDVQTIDEVLRRHGESAPESIAVEFEGLTITYRQLDRDATRVANWLSKKGIVPGDRIAAISRNNAGILRLIFAASRLGAVLVQLNARLTVPEISFMLEDSEARLVFSDAGCSNTAQEAVIRAPRCGGHYLISESGDIEALQADAPPASYAESSRDAAVLQLYTSGTTGGPKGVVLTQANLLALARGGCEALGHFGSRTANLICLPIFHVGGIDWLMFALLSRSPIVLMKDVIPKAVLTALVDKEVTGMLLVPTVVRMVVEEAEQRNVSIPSLKMLTFGASPMTTELIARTRKVFPNASLYHVYGMTETSGMFTSIRVSEQRLESCGKPWTGSEIKVIDESGKPLGPNQVGHIICRSPQLMPGYWKRPEANEEILREGWFHTGDAGYLDEEGFLYVKDRVKDMVKTGGENVYPAEVEEALSGHPSVAEVAVIGVPDPKWDERVLAVVRLRQGHVLDRASLEEFARRKLAGYKVPRQYETVDELPRTASGKVVKSELRARFSS